MIQVHRSTHAPSNSHSLDGENGLNQKIATNKPASTTENALAIEKATFQASDIFKDRSTTQMKNVAFSSNLVTVHEVPNYFVATDEEKSRIWYSQEESRKIYQAANNTAGFANNGDNDIITCINDTYSTAGMLGAKINDEETLSLAMTRIDVSQSVRFSRNQFICFLAPSLNYPMYSHFFSCDGRVWQNGAYTVIIVD